MPNELKNTVSQPYKIEFHWEKMSEKEIERTIKKFNLTEEIITPNDPNWNTKIEALFKTD